MSSRLTRAGGFRQGVTTVAPPTISAAPRVSVSAISIEPSRIGARSTTASISRQLSDANAIAGDEAIATGYDADDAEDRDAVERRPVVADPACGLAWTAGTLSLTRLSAPPSLVVLSQETRSACCLMRPGTEKVGQARSLKAFVVLLRVDVVGPLASDRLESRSLNRLNCALVLSIPCYRIGGATRRAVNFPNWTGTPGWRHSPHRSRTTSPTGREQQMSRLPVAGRSSGWGSYTIFPETRPLSQLWQTPVRHAQRTGTSHASASSNML